MTRAAAGPSIVHTSSPISGGAATSIHQHLLELERALGVVIRGNGEAVHMALVALLSEGHLLIEDVPGVGKTTMAHALANSIACQFHRVQFTSDLLPSDVVGVSIYNQAKASFEFKPGPVFTNILLADEINRTTPKTQSALLEAMNERQVTVDNQTYPLPDPFMVIATQNPVEHHGTYPLPESQLDRFVMRIRMGYPTAQGEREILRATQVRNDSRNGANGSPGGAGGSNGAGGAGGTMLSGLKGPIADAAQIHEWQNAARQVAVEDTLLDYALKMVARTREHEHIALGVSPRGSQALFRAAQSLALLEGRAYCIPDDFKRLAIPVFSHRIVISPRYVSAQKKSDQAESLVREILDSTEVPL
ncbi:MAG: MoxR family ATPase [Acidobacteria bacterium]|nr:MoxR family ATPase [Acidobacteriota bacterium]